MKVVVINGSPRANGATGQILRYICETLQKMDGALEIEYIDLGKLQPKPCTGCLACYKTGACYIKDDGLEDLAHQMEESDGVIFGSPTYASNVSGQFKILIDRGHFIFEQLLRDKACFSVATYENVGGKAALKIIDELIHYSGGSVSARYSKKLNHGTKAVDEKTAGALNARCAKFLRRVHKQVPLSVPERVLRHMVFHFGLKPHALKNAPRYGAIIDRWVATGLAMRK